MNLTNEAIKLFVKKQCDLEALHVKKSIISAAAMLANATDIVDENTVRRVLATEFQIDPSDTVIFTQYLGGNIGFDTDLMDYNSARLFYESNKTTLDAFYQTIKEAALTPNKDEKTM